MSICWQPLFTAPSGNGSDNIQELNYLGITFRCKLNCACLGVHVHITKLTNISVGTMQILGKDPVFVTCVWIRTGIQTETRKRKSDIFTCRNVHVPKLPVHSRKS